MWAAVHCSRASLPECDTSLNHGLLLQATRTAAYSVLGSAMQLK